jgi:hypothetical protein
MKVLKRERVRDCIVMYERARNLYVPVQRFLASPLAIPSPLPVLHFNTHRVLLYSSAYNSSVCCHSNQ